MDDPSWVGATFVRFASLYGRLKLPSSESQASRCWVGWVSSTWRWSSNGSEANGSCRYEPAR
eukprot:scaffold22955_cov107-Isochrysis_galbana.AAC.2